MEMDNIVCKLEERRKKETSKLINKLETNACKSEERLKKETSKLINKLEKKEQMLDAVKEVNKKR